MSSLGPTLRLFALNCLAVLAFLVLALTSWLEVGLVCAAVVLAFVAWWSRDSGLANYVSVRLLTVCGLLVAWDAEVGVRSDPLILVSGGLLIVILVHERVLRSLAGAKRVRAANLPEYTGRTKSVVEQQAVFAFNLTAVVALGFFAAFAWPAWPMFLFTVGMAALSGYVLLDAVRARRSFGGDTADLTASLEARAPEFMVHFSGPVGSQYQLTMWLPYFERIGRPFVVILREAHAFPEVSEATRAPVLVCTSIASLESAIVPSLRAVFYVNNGMKNTHAVRFSHLTHIQLLHGDSDKAPSFNPVTAMFDRIFVAGEAGIDRYAANGVEIPRDKFSIVGRPQVEQVELAPRPINEVTSPVVLYTPTWVGHNQDANYCSLPVGADLVRALIAKGATVMLRAHPYTSHDPDSMTQLAAAEQVLADDRAASGRRHQWGEAVAVGMSLFECLNASDALVADVSSVVSDYLFSEKPFAIVEVLADPSVELEPGADAAVFDSASFLESFPVARAAYVLHQDASNWDEMLGHLLHDDPLQEERRVLKTYYLGPFPKASYAEGFLDEARSYLADAD